MVLSFSIKATKYYIPYSPIMMVATVLKSGMFGRSKSSFVKISSASSADFEVCMLSSPAAGRLLVWGLEDARAQKKPETQT